MEETLRRLVVETGQELLEKGLVARTWGNVSARVDRDHFLITPSGLDYTRTEPEDLALYDFKDDSYVGHYKPSSEKGIHASAYELFEDAGFVIHTHQTYASAFGVYGFEKLEMTEKEHALLGGIAEADYGLPGTKKLKKAVRVCFEKGAHTVLMKNHGAVVVGKDKEDAFAKIQLLEEICRRNYRGHDSSESAAIAYSMLGIPLVAQLDDMAQMIGAKIPVVKEYSESALERCHAILIPGKGIMVKGMDEDDTRALEILVEKAAITALHTRSYGANCKLSWFDCKLMNLVYKKKYSKKKNSGK